jgi:hypothetical protein
MAYRVNHRKQGETKGQRYARESDFVTGQYRRTASGKDKHEGSDKLSEVPRHSRNPPDLDNVFEIA